MRFLWMILTFAIMGTIALIPETGQAAEFVVYSVYKGIDLGNPGEVAQKDFYVNMGSAQGLRPGSHLEVLRRISTYDTVSQKLYADVTFAIGKLKVIHVERDAAVARLESIMPAEKIPAVNPRAVMVGDLVRQAASAE
ncbi:MAG: hypothetical protein ACXWP5_03540 [Bdellovibrionota bacterium]